MSKARRFTVSILGPADGLEPRVEMRVDGYSLLDMIRDAERPLAAHEGTPALAGNYTWPLLTPRLVRLLSGERPGTQRVEGVLLNCECGWASCWPLTARIRTYDRFVIWQDLRQLKRLARWDYRELEPLRFMRPAYLNEVEKLREGLVRLSDAMEVRRLANRARDESNEVVCAL